MSFNGSGSFLINTAGQPVVSGTVISSTAFNALTADLATGLSTCITKDGQTTVTANIPMANYKFTGLGAGSAAGDSANLSQVQSTVVKLLASVSGTDTITAVGSPTVAAYAAGQMFYFVAAGDNTGAVTINIDSLGAKAVTRDGSVALEAGDIKSGEMVVIVYDGTRFQVVSQLNSSGDARFANVSIASALNVGGVATVTGGAVLNGGVVINEPGADVDFRVESDTDANCLFVDASANNVGIGTSSPARKLDIYDATAPTFALHNSTSGTGSTDGFLLFTLGSDTTLLNYENGYMAFSTNATERARIDSAGNLGLGVTPSAWGVTAFQIARGSLYGSNSAVGVQHNAYFDGSNWKYIASSVQASQYDQFQGTHRWFTAGTGTAGNAITFTQAMTLDASGNLAVGTTSANGRLDVVGTTSAIRAETTNGVYYLREFGGSAANNTIEIGIRPDSGKSGYLTFTEDAVADRWSVGIANGEGSLRFISGTPTGGTERARITAGGNLLVGTTADSTARRMRVYGSEASAASTSLVLQNSSSGTGNADGFSLELDGTSAYLWNYENAEIRIGTNNTERARITSGGELIIGTTSAAGSERLRVRGAGNTSATYNCIFENSDGTLVFNFENAGKFRTGTLADSPYNYVVGGTNRDLFVDSTGYIGYVSSTRESKDNIVSLSNVSWLLGLNPVTFNRRKRNEDREYTDELYKEKEYGLIAEEVEAVNVDLCFYDDAENGGKLRGVTYSKLITPMLKLLQEQQAMINDLKAKVAALEGA